MATVRYKDKPEIVGFTSRFNTSSIGEVVVAWRDGDGSSEYIGDLEVQIGSTWIAMRDAFRDGDLITDNYNTCFYEPRSDEDRERGYTL